MRTSKSGDGGQNVERKLSRRESRAAWLRTHGIDGPHWRRIESMLHTTRDLEGPLKQAFEKINPDVPPDRYIEVLSKALAYLLHGWRKR